MENDNKTLQVSLESGLMSEKTCIYKDICVSDGGAVL